MRKMSIKNGKIGKKKKGNRKRKMDMKIGEM